MLHAETMLRLPDDSSVRIFTPAEAHSLADSVGRRNVFSRHSRESDFYVQRARALAGHTVLEVFRAGHPDAVAEEMAEAADLIEQLSVLSAALAGNRDSVRRSLGVSARRRAEIDFIAGPELRRLRSRTRSAGQPRGICVDGRLVRRFAKRGFHELYVACLSSSRLAGDTRSALRWVFESLREPDLSTSVVKTAIGLETLLAVSESEPLARVLSERAAFMLSGDMETRAEISSVLKRFYGVRSRVVHGGRKTRRQLTPSLLSGVERLSVLLFLVVAANSAVWSSKEELRAWCDSQRWGAARAGVTTPFPAQYLRNALSLCRQDSAAVIDSCASRTR